MCSTFCPWSSIASAASRPDVRLFLFDIDGTLISSRGVGRRALARAPREVYGTHGSIEGYFVVNALTRR